MQRLAIVLRQRGAGAEAAALTRERLERALATVVDANDARLPALLVELASAELERDADDQARAHAERALAVANRVFGVDHVQTAAAHDMLAHVDCDQGRHEPCAAHLQRSLEIRVARFGEHHPQVAVAAFNLGTMWLYERQDPARALPPLERAVAIARDFHGEDDYNLNYYRVELGAALADLGRVDAARAALTATRDAFERMALPDGLKLARARAELACLDLRDGGGDTARGVIAQSLATMARKPVETDAERARLSLCLDTSRDAAP
jgi:tetratricopeptide (TPR) repeat protein